MTDNETDAHQGRGYRIGAVCRLTGLSPHVLRVWEKRYGIVKPQRLPNRRRVYSEAEIEKLSLLKTLVDRGQAIGTLADLDTAELAQRVQASDRMVQPAPTRPPRIAVVGEVLRIQAASWPAQDSYELIGTYRTVAELGASAHGTGLDGVVLEWPTVHPDSGVEANRVATRLNVGQLILVYHYGSQSALNRLDTSRVTAMRAPVDDAALDALISQRFGRRPTDTPGSDAGATPAPPRQFSERQLAHIAQQAAAVGCECPRHLSELIGRLHQFETYSSECESRNAEDAAVHHYLYVMTSQARGLIENALTRVIELEGLSPEPAE